MTVAALYVDTVRGPYAAIPDVDCWGVERDARAYAGPHAVVAHPPCGHWGAFRAKCIQPHGERDCGAVAVQQVRAFGGVLEHPARSALWTECGMPRPGEAPDAWGGYTIAVRQCDWGHRGVKPTWLYVVGLPQADLPALPSSAPSPRGRLCSTGRYATAFEWMPKSQRHLTPPALALWLVEVARRVERHLDAADTRGRG